MRDELVRRDYTASTIRSYIQIVEAFREHTGARLDRVTRPSSDATTCFSSRSGDSPWGWLSRRFARSGSSVGMFSSAALSDDWRRAGYSRSACLNTFTR
jgi:hypothetical protein